uniref:Reverse transcriptase Ty1/copia-type domain-containing protein n=1 Tax=Strigamia maritima TaxID=126957 RepID=T1IZD6_STRMM
MSQTAYILKLAHKYKLVPNSLVKVPVTVGTTLTRDPNLLERDQTYSIRLLLYLKCVWAYTDASWASDPLTSLSFGGFIVFLGGAPIVWSCKKQSSVACSTMEAEFVALVNCVGEVYWLCSVFKSCHLFNYRSIPVIYSDEMSSIQFTTNDVENSRTKHIRVKYHWLREWYDRERFDLHMIPGDLNVADIFTKWLDGSRVRFLFTKVFTGVLI